MILYLIILLSITLCALCCYSCIVRQRRLQQRKLRNRSGKSNYVKNIQSFYSASGEVVDDDEIFENGLSGDIDPSSIPSHLIKDVLLQGDDVSNVEEPTVNDGELPAYVQERLDYSSNDSFHFPHDDVFQSGSKNENLPLSTFGDYAQHGKVSSGNGQKTWVKFDDDVPSDSLIDSDLGVLEEELEVKRRQQLNEDDGLLQSGNLENETINLGFENDHYKEVVESHQLSPLNCSTIVASQLPI